VTTRILLVDDEPALLELLTKYLERLGYQVDACLNAEDAIARFDADAEKYALVLTDLSLIGMSGEEMLDHMRVRLPSLRAIISSGYPYVPKSKKIVFLQKPFVPKMLAVAIEKLIGPRSADI
jgi:two-component system cell cycle sensor histidine kinase/response regulator CckA